MKFGVKVGHGDHNKWSKDEVKIRNIFDKNPKFWVFSQILKLTPILSNKSQSTLLRLKLKGILFSLTWYNLFSKIRSFVGHLRHIYIYARADFRTDKIKISCCCHGNQRWDLTFMACLVFYYLYKIVLKSCDCIIL